MENVDLMQKLLDGYRIIQSPERVLCAVSGGADSVALLCLLSALAHGKEPFRLIAAHVNHGLREASAAEENAVEELCRKLDVPLRIWRVEVPKQGNTENEARKMRYNALFSIAQEEACEVIALAHHARDQAETVLMRLMRGCGDGVTAMAEYSKRANGIALWRPLLGVHPEELRGYLRTQGINWCEDESNRDETYLRNFLRRRVLPELEHRDKDTLAHFCKSAALLSDEHAFVVEQARKMLTLCSGKDGLPYLDVTMLMDQHIALRRTAVRLFLKERMDEVPFSAAESVMTLKSGCQCVLRNSTILERYGNRVYLLPETGSLYPEGRLYTSQYDGRNRGDGKWVQVIPKALFEGSELRFRKEGDIISPFGMKGTKTLSDYMTDRKIPRPIRDRIPLLCRENRVLWVIGHGADSLCRVGENEEAVLVAYMKDQDESAKI